MRVNVLGILLLLSIIGYNCQNNQTYADFNTNCFGCIMNGYNWCQMDYSTPTQRGVCSPKNIPCKNVTFTFNNGTGCPTRIKCNVGANGFVSLDGTPSNNQNLSSGAISTNQTINFNIDAPSGIPCYAVIQNTR